ncbi:MAG: hypothetical protein IBJ18_10720 [Phycisphaerales bacterium]|nr:hypothetical protein [Phycisphaerales bacterium]
MKHEPSSTVNQGDGLTERERSLMLAFDALDDARRVGDADRVAAASRRVIDLGGDRAMREYESLKQGLKERFEPPAPDEEFLRSIRDGAAGQSVPTVVVEVRPGGVFGSLRARPVRALAAAILVILCAWVAYVQFTPAKADPGAMYNQIVRAGFTPMEVCTDDAEFQKYTRTHYGVALTFAKSTTAIELVGWNYNVQLHTPGTGALLARVKGKPVVVFIDAAGMALGVKQPSDKSLSAFRTRLGPLIFDEITPLDAPYVSRSLSLPAER